MAINNPNDPTNPLQADVQGIEQPVKPQAVGMAPQTGVQTMTATAAKPPALDLNNAENDGVAGIVTEITSKNSPLMKQARSSGMRAANARGMLNSSIGVGAAEDSAYKVATPIAMQEAAQRAGRNQSRLNIAGELERLRQAAGYDAIARKETFGQQDKMQDKDLKGQMDRLDKAAAYDTTARRETFAQQSSMIDKEAGHRMEQLKTSIAAEIQKLDKQIASAEGMQREELKARRENLILSSELEVQRMGVAFEFNKTMAAIQNGYQVDLTKLQGQIQSQLQAQSDSAAMQRLNTQTAAAMQQQMLQGAQQLEAIAAQGSNQQRLQATELQQRMQELTLNLNNNNSQAAANAAVQLFNTEAQLRASLLNNPNMPASERAAYDRAISGMTGPVQNYVASVLGGGAPSGGGEAGGMQPTYSWNSTDGKVQPVQPGGMAPTGFNANDPAQAEAALQAMGLGSRGDPVATLQGHLAGQIEGQLPAEVRARYNSYAGIR